MSLILIELPSALSAATARNRGRRRDPPAHDLQSLLLDLPDAFAAEAHALPRLLKGQWRFVSESEAQDDYDPLLFTQSDEGTF